MPDELTTAPKKVTEVARTDFQQEQRDLIRNTVAPEATQAEFDLFLEIAARYQLNPLTGEIYLAKMGGTNGGGGRFTMLVGRDGFLAIANRNPDFRGIESDVVHEFDTFKKTKDGVIHEYEMGSGGEMPRDKPPEADGEPGVVMPSIKKRGAIVGAWAIVHRQGRVPTFFFAPYASYAKNHGPWKQYPDAMIRKVAIANALREAFNLSGLYHESEIEQLRAEQAGSPTGEPEGFGTDEIGARLDGLVEEARTVLPGKYLPARVHLVLQGKDDDERKAFADALEAELEAAANPPDVDVVDAEVVDEPAVSA